MTHTERPGLARRLFARLFDLSLYIAVWRIVLALVFDVNILSRNGAGSLMDVAVAFVCVRLCAVGECSAAGSPFQRPPRPQR